MNFAPRVKPNPEDTDRRIRARVLKRIEAGSAADATRSLGYQLNAMRFPGRGRLPFSEEGIAHNWIVIALRARIARG